MDPLSVGMGIAAIAGQAANAATQGKINRRTMAFQKNMWDATNKYNSPIEQRKRLEAAGLNPNLVYGGSAGQTAGDASNISAPDQKAPNFDLASGVSGVLDTVYSTKSKRAGIDVQEAQTDHIKQETINSALDSLNKVIRNNKDKLSYKQKQRLFQTEIETAQARLENINVDTRTKSAADQRAERITNATVPKLQEELKYLRKKGKHLDQEVIMKRIDRELYENHRVRPNDPAYYRIMTRILDALDPDQNQIFQRGPLKGLLD